MKTIKLISIMWVSVLLFGCASGALKENMVYKGDQKSYDQNLNDSVEVGSISGGEKTNPAWTSEISNEAFSGAVKISLAEQGLLSKDGKYQLSVKLIKVEQPMFGFDMTVTTHVQYVLTDTRNSTILLDEIVVSPHTATVGDAFAGIKRLRLANEGSGKKNIEGLLDKLAILKISVNEISVNEISLAH